MQLFGVPLPIWSVVCLALSIVWVFVWPSKTTVTAGLRFFILRWFHSIVWLLLAAAAFIAGFNILGAATAARQIALLSLITYLAFMFTVATARRK